MKIRTLVLGAVVSAGALAAMAAPASAYVVCNRSGDCWRTHERYAYQPTFGLSIHDDSWRWRARDHYRWRDIIAAIGAATASGSPSDPARVTL